MRSLKPSFFTDADLAAFPPLHRIAFEGLWCHADKAGRLEDKPRELKVKILPYDACDFDRILVDLAHPKGDEPGFIRRYTVGCRRYIAITRFGAHQNPHHKEPDSDLPEPPPWEPVPPIDASDIDPGEDGAGPGPTPSQPTGFLVLGSGSLVLGAGNAEAAPPPAKPESSPPPPGFSVVAPATPPEQWLAGDFWRWAQSVRMRAQLPPERQPNQHKLSHWWSSTLMVEGVTPRALQRGFERFGQSDHWETTDPPYPFAAFMSQWEQFTRMEAPDEAHAS